MIFQESTLKRLLQKAENRATSSLQNASWYVRNHVKLHAGTKVGPYTKIIWNNNFAGKIKEFATHHGQGQEFALCKSVVEIVLESYEENKIVKDG